MLLWNDLSVRVRVDREKEFVSFDGLSVLRKEGEESNTDGGKEDSSEDGGDHSLLSQKVGVFSDSVEE